MYMLKCDKRPEMLELLFATKNWTIASQKEDILWPYFVEPHSLRYDEYCEQGGDEEDYAYHDAGQLVVQWGAGVEEDWVAVEDHDVEAAEVEEEEHDQADDEGLEDVGLQ